MTWLETYLLCFKRWRIREPPKKHSDFWDLDFSTMTLGRDGNFASLNDIVSSQRLPSAAFIIGLESIHPSANQKVFERPSHCGRHVAKAFTCSCFYFILLLLASW
jgi:hypothetical protein